MKALFTVAKNMPCKMFAGFPGNPYMLEVAFVSSAETPEWTNGQLPNSCAHEL